MLRASWRRAWRRGSLDPAPIWSDIRTFNGRAWRGVVDIVTSGFPCQPFSVAGKRRHEDDGRHLWPHIAAIVGECKPTLVFLENVSLRAFGSRHKGQWKSLRKAFLPTTQATDWKDSRTQGNRKSPRLLPTLSTGHGNNQGGAAGRVGKVRESLDRLLATPTIAARSLPTQLLSTPISGQGGPSNGPGRAVKLCYQIGGQVNPAWKEWFVGLPIGWTAIVPLETSSFLKWRRSLSNHL